MRKTIILLSSLFILLAAGALLADVTVGGGGGSATGGSGSFSGTFSLNDGTVGAPSLFFTDDTDLGIYSSAANTMELVSGGFPGIQIEKSAGNFTNVGFPDASTSVNYPFYVKRDQDAETTFAIENVNGGASAASRIQLINDTGAAMKADFTVWPAAQTLNAYTSRAVIRSSDSTTGISLVAAGAANSDVKIYSDGGAVGDMIAHFAADGSLYLPISAAEFRVGIAGTATTFDSADPSVIMLEPTANHTVAIMAGPSSDGALALITEATANDFYVQAVSSGDGVTAEDIRINPQGAQTYLGNAVNSVSLKGYTSCTALTTNGSDVIGCTASDERLKKNIVPFERGLEALAQIKPISFRFKDPADMNMEHSGFSAQNVEKVIPEAVRIGSDGMRMIDYWTIIAVQANAINELRQRVEALEGPKVKALKKNLPVKAVAIVPETKHPTCVGPKKFCADLAQKRKRKW